MQESGSEGRPHTPQLATEAKQKSKTKKKKLRWKNQQMKKVTEKNMDDLMLKK